MRRFLGGLLDKTLVNLVYHVESRVKLKKGTPDKPNVYDELRERAIKRSADYVEAHLSSVLLFYNRKQMWDYAASLITLNGLNIEFGVHRGDSINYLAQKLNSRGAVIFGFDSFEGLQEDWKGSTSPKGTFDLGGILPPVRPNVTLSKDGSIRHSRLSWHERRRELRSSTLTRTLMNRHLCPDYA